MHAIDPADAESTLTPPISITREDYERLRALVDRYVSGSQGPAAEMLDAELTRAHVLPQSEIGGTVVTMRSRIRFEDVETGTQREAVLVYPDEADSSQGRISVLAPVGMALLGASVGHCVSWPVPSGKNRTLRVISILYQPEAAGEFQL